MEQTDVLQHSVTVEEPLVLTTIDNPYHPIKQFDEWYAFDTANGYNTLAYIDRVSLWTPELNPVDETVTNNQAIREILDSQIFLRGGFF
jgi:hypothetical protein